MMFLMLKLAGMFTSELDLLTLAIIGLNIRENVVAGHVKSKNESIAMAAYAVLREWRAGQTNNHVAYENVCSALRKVGMGNFIANALQ